MATVLEIVQTCAGRGFHRFFVSVAMEVCSFHVVLYYPHNPYIKLFEDAFASSMTAHRRSLASWLKLKTFSKSPVFVCSSGRLGTKFSRSVVLLCTAVLRISRSVLGFSKFFHHFGLVGDSVLLRERWDM